MTHTPYLDWLARDLEAPITPERRHDGFGPDLIIGYATNYEPAALAPFVLSLRAFSKARVGLVASPTPTVKRFFAEQGVERFDPPVQTGWRPHIHLIRQKHYLSVLSAYPDARRVLILDVRDLAFQGDPFAHGFGDEQAELAMYAETGPGGFARQGANTRWATTLIGAGLAHRLGDSMVVCGGTVMGRVEPIKRMLRSLLSLAAIQRSGLLEHIGADQSAMNVIAHWGLQDVFVAPNYRRTATIGHADPLRVDGDVLRNPDGSVSPILHQYDRHADANALITQRWSLPGASATASAKPGALAKVQHRWRRSFTKRWPEWR
jgi:hypothetical protein